MSKTSRFLQNRALFYMSRVEHAVATGKVSKRRAVLHSLRKWRKKAVDFDLVEPFIYEVYGDCKKHSEIVEKLICQWIESIQVNKA